MNIMNALTVRYLKQNRRRSLITICGVIISVAMISAVTTIGVSFLDLMRRDTIATDGEWHVRYFGVTAEQAAAIRADQDTKNSMLTRDLGYALLPKAEKSERPYLFVQAMDEESFRQFGVKLSSGRMPENDSELLVSDTVANSGTSYQLGDVVTLELGTRWPLDPSGNRIEGEKRFGQNSSFARDEHGEPAEEFVPETSRTYTVVGTFEQRYGDREWSAGYPVLTRINGNTLTADETGDLSVAVKKLDRDLFERSTRLAASLGIDTNDVDFHNGLLRYYGIIQNDGLNETLYSFLGILLAIIMVGSIFMIYNAFAISISQRSRQLGMLSSVGATKRQKRNSVFFEGAVIGAIGIPLGIIFGIAGIGITFHFVNPIITSIFARGELVGGLYVVVSPASLLVAAAVSVLTILLSTWIPARRASKVSAIDAIRQTQDVKLTRRNVKTSRLTRAIFGFEGELGLKNLKRNRGRYYATILSLAVSVILFIAASTFSLYLNIANGLTEEGVNFDILVMNHTRLENQVGFQATVDQMEQMRDAEHIEEGNCQAILVMLSELSAEQAPDYYQNFQLVQSGDESEDQTTVNLYGLDAVALEKYAREVGVDPEKLQETDHPAGIVIDQVEYRANRGATYTKAKAINAKAGDRIALFSYSDEERLAIPPIEIAALTDNLPIGISNKGTPGVLHIITSQENVKKYLAYYDQPSIAYQLALTTSDADALEKDIREIQKKLGVENDYSIMNYHQMREQQEQLSMMIQIFTYGFVILIMLICLANIINTISTGIALRRREFAMLKSVGMTHRSFRKMIIYESLFYGIKSLLLSLPISFLIIWLMHKSLAGNFAFALSLPWSSIIVAIVAVFVFVGITMLYALGKTKKQNIAQALTEENI